MNREDQPRLIGIDGHPLPQTIAPESAKLPGRLGYGIAVPDPGRAIPYLQTTLGRPVNTIGELHTFDYAAVIDLGTPADTAHLHRKETEALGMRYYNIPVAGTLPERNQILLFTQSVVDASSSLLLVYAPSAELLGSMWAAHLINLGAPFDFAINEGKKLGMGANAESGLRRRFAGKRPR
ncbi:MAG: hypothetical protein KZQ93_19980 [Candidatus Thiodiazotropha sp. (ex Monitilora ramsayi)]|nr:hypothetical protein [Candidatus Thiodiazotropha sp. (ex Monitilora ramsayi)]